MAAIWKDIEEPRNKAHCFAHVHTVQDDLASLALDLVLVRCRLDSGIVFPVRLETPLANRRSRLFWELDTTRSVSFGVNSTQVFLIDIPICLVLASLASGLAC